MKYYIGIDLGGTFIKAGVVDENYNVLAKETIPSEVDGNDIALAERMVECAKMALNKLNLTIDDIESVGVGTPGAVDVKNGIVLYSCNLQFEDTPLAKYISDRINKSVYIDNDANVAAFGEALAGAAKGVSDVIMITLGTGVGGGIIIDGKIYSGFNGIAGELGHMVIKNDGVTCGCGRKGCIEAYASASALVRMTKEAMEKNPDSKLWEVAKTLDDVNGKTSFDAMRLGDEVGISVVNEYIEYLGCGLANFVNIFQPEVLIIGGGICKEGETLLKPLREILSAETYGVGNAPATTLKIAELGNDAGTIGAAMLWKMHN